MSNENDHSDTVTTSNNNKGKSILINNDNDDYKPDLDLTLGLPGRDCEKPSQHEGIKNADLDTTKSNNPASEEEGLIEWRCKRCGKSFDKYQGLGGHQSKCGKPKRKAGLNVAPSGPPPKRAKRGRPRKEK